MGKQHGTAYPKGIPYRTIQQFEIVLSGRVWSKACQFPWKFKVLIVTFVDDYSRYVHNYFIKSKEELLGKFKEFANYTANTTGKKVLHSDNGGEYCSKAFEAYLKESEIVQQTTVPYNPAQNGVAVQMNQTLLETSRSGTLQSTIRVLG